jgi:hypothetical protein
LHLGVVSLSLSAYQNTNLNPLACLSVAVPDAVVVNRYQLLRSINPSIELVVEMMLPQNVAYLSPTTPVPGVHHKYLHLLSPAYISGCGECWRPAGQQHAAAAMYLT